MSSSTSKKKNKIRQKLDEFTLYGLKSYRKYIVNELESTPKTKLKRAYRAYLDKELERSTKKIKKLKKRI
jgi:hypothetical protein